MGRPILASIALLVLILAGSCVELLSDPHALRAPRGLQLDSPQIEMVAGDTVEVSATVTDQQGVPFQTLPEGQPLSWTSSDTAVARVESDPGNLTARLMAGEPGSAQLTVALGALSVSGGVLVREGVDRLEAEGGSGQSGVVALPLDQPLAVRAVTAEGMPVEGVLITFHVLEGGGALSPESAPTDEEGVARAEWTLGTVAGLQRAEARYRSLDPVPFDADAAPGDPAVVVVSPPEVAFDALGDTLRFSVSAEDEHGNPLEGVDAVWTSSDPEVAQVDEEGLVTGVGRGEALISASVDAVEGTAGVFVDPEVFQVAVEPDEAVFTALGDTLRFQARAVDRNGNELQDVDFQWEAQDPSVATVDGTGLVTAQEPGSTGIRAGANGRADTASVTVTQEPHEVSILAAPEIMNALGQTRQLQAQVTDRNGFPVPGAAIEWSSQDEDVATVDPDGVVEGVGVGTTLVVAGSGELSDQVEVTVRQVPASVTVVPDFLEMSVGDVETLSAVAADSNSFVISSPDFVWGSLDPTVAGVDAEGEVTAVGQGETSILAVLDGVEGSAEVVVTAGEIEIDFICVFPSQATIAVGDSVQLEARAVLPGDEGCSNVEGLVYTWTSSDPEVASVTQEGLVRGEGPGFAVITAAASGREGSANVEVILLEPLFLRSLGAGFWHSCGVDEDGHAWCWGQGWNGNLGDGEFSSRSTAVPVVGDQEFASIGGGLDWSCALTSDGEAWCWGSNWIGQLGQSPNPYWGTTVPEAVPTPYRFAQLDGGEIHNCGAATTGESLCTGDNFWGALGVGDYTDRHAFTPNVGGVSFQKVSAGWMHTCGITPGGAAYCWGDDRMGETGNGETYDFPNAPVPVDTQLAFMDITTGGSFTCALTTAGAAWCWGANYYGMLGVEDPPDECRPFSGASLNPCATTPVAVNTGLTFTRISAGESHVCALTAGGDAYCWGWGGTGALGHGSYVDSTTPVLVSGGHHFVDLALGWYHSCAVTDNDEVWCWGDGWSGQLANGSFNNDSPVPVRAWATTGGTAPLTLGEAAGTYQSTSSNPELAEWLRSRTTREATPPFRRTPRE